jgi:hypothetical protein
MSSDDGFVAQIGGLSRALAPLVEATSSPEALAALLVELGCREPRRRGGRRRRPRERAARALAGTLPRRPRRRSSRTSPRRWPRSAGWRAPMPGAGALFGDPAFWSGLPVDLFALLVHDIQQNKPRLYGFLSACSDRATVTDATTGRRPTLRASSTSALAARPPRSGAGSLTCTAGWFDHDRFDRARGARGRLGGAVSEHSLPRHSRRGTSRPTTPTGARCACCRSRRSRSRAPRSRTRRR